MQPSSSGRTPVVGFRRDVTLFLSALVGFLIVLILVLVTLLQVTVGQTEEMVRSQWQRAADQATRSINQLDTTSGSSAVEAALIGIQGQLGISAIELQMRTGNRVLAGDIGAEEAETIEQRTRLGTVAYRFDRSPLDDARRRLFWASFISITAAIAGAILLLLYVRRISRPIEQLLEQAGQIQQRDHGVEETHYLIETFRSTIATLRTQEAELKSLHEQEKARADDLERVTATLTRSLTSGFLAIDPSGRLLEMNDAAREILGAKSNSVAGLTPREALGDTPFALAIAGASDSRNALNRVEVPVHRGDQVKRIGVSTVPLSDEEGRYLGLLALFTDLTPIRDLEDRVRELRALADLGEVSAGIAHEFRNSLSTILGYLKLARRSSLDPEVDGRLNAAEEEAAQLGKAVTALLHFAHPMSIQELEVPLRPLLETIASRLEDYAEGVPIRIDGPDLVVQGDQALLSRAFENLIRNAIEAVRRTDRAGSVSVELRQSRWPGVTIEDDGIGLAGEEIPSLFLPFRSGRPGGFGLGLALAKKIILLHGGNIGMEARAEGGTRVKIEFPESSEL